MSVNFGGALDLCVIHALVEELSTRMLSNRGCKWATVRPTEDWTIPVSHLRVIAAPVICALARLRTTQPSASVWGPSNVA